MCFSVKTKTTSRISPQNDGEPITEVFKYKFLDVMVDNKLSWKDHVHLCVERSLLVVELCSMNFDK